MIRSALTGTEGLVTLSSSGVDIAGSLDTDGHFKVADTKFTIDVSGNTYADGTLGVKGLATLQNNLELSKTDAAIEHTGTGATTGLTISSDNGYVDVESVRFTNVSIGTTTDVDLVNLANAAVTIKGSLDTDGYIKVATTKFVVDASGNTYADGTFGVKGVSTLQDDLELSEDSAAITHTGTTSLAISSTNGHITIAGGSSVTDYVDVESVRFTGDKIGLSGDTAIMQLTTSGSVGNVAIDGTVTMIDDVTSLTHTGATSLAIESTNGHITIAGGANDYVDVESVRFTGDQIGLSGDTAIMQLTTSGSVGNVAIDGTVTMIDDVTSLTHTGATSLAISSTNGHITIAGGANDYVDVESVRFTDDYIGISTDTDIIQLTSTGSQATMAIVADVDVTGKMDVSSDFEIGTSKFKVVEQTGAVTMSSDAQTITHTGATSLTMSSSAANAYVMIEGGSSAYVQVESVKITDNQIGSVGDPSLITLVNDKMSLAGALDLTVDAATITHTGTTSLAISSTNGVVTIAGGSGATDYVDVESVRFTNDYIGISGDTDIIRLTSTGSQATVAIVADVDVTGKMDVSLDFAVNTDKFKVDATSGAVTMSSDAQTITHTGATSLTMSSSAANAYVKIEGGSSAYVQVESVKITDNQIGSVGDPSLITLVNEKMSLAGALDLTNEDATITHTGSTGTPTLTISSTNGPVSVVSTAEYVDVESVRFTGDQIGLSGDTAIMQLTTSGSVGNVAIDGTVTMIDDVTSLTHTGATSLAIESTNGHITIAGGSSAYVQVESVKITDNQIGSVGDPDLITLVNEKMSLAGALDLTVDAATITHTGTTSLAISSTNGVVTIAGGSGATDYVDVESVRFTDASIGTSGDADLITLADDKVTIKGSLDTDGYIKVATTKFVVDASGNTYADGTFGVKGVSTLQDDLELSEDSAAITHTGTTSLAISSTNGHITIAGGSLTTDYVDVESVRFTDDFIGTTGDADLVRLEANKVTVKGTLTTTDDILMSEATASLTHDAGTSGVGLAITSTNGYVDVESVRFTDNQIGLHGTDGLVTLSSSGVDIAGSLDTDGYFKVADTKFTIDVSGNTYADGTLGVKGLASLQNNLELSKTDAAIKHTGTGATTGLTISSDNGYVDVESVRFTNVSIGTTTDVDLVNLANAAVTIKGSLDTDGYIKVATTKFVVDASGNTYADGTFGVKGVSTLQDDLELSEDSAAITHTGTTSLAISSTNGHITIAGGSSVTDYVDVESVRFTDASIGTTGDADLVTLADDKVTIKGSLDTDGYIKVATTKFVVDASGNTYADGTFGVKGVSTLQDDLELSEDSAAITHTGTTSLAISSTNGHITIAGGSSVTDYVDVESVRFTGDKIGLSGDTAIMQLTTSGSVGNVAIDGTVTMIDDVTSLTHTGATSLAISSTYGHITIAGGANDYVDVESVRFTDDYIGISTDTDIIRLTSTGSQATVAIVADVDVTGKMDVSLDFAVNTDKFKVDATSGAVTMSSDAQTITHTGATSLTMSSSAANAYVKIEGGSSAYVQVESVKITDNQIGSVGDPSLITLVNEKMSLAGALDLTNEDATITHKGSTGTPTLTISSTNGPVSVVSTAEYVDVESVRFTGDQIGLSGDTAIMQLTTSGSVGNVAIDGTVTMIDDVTSLTHTGATSLAIESTNGHITIAGGSLATDYVDVESVRFTDDYIGISTDTDIIQLTSTGSQATVAIVADVDVTGKMDVSSDFEIGTSKFKVVEQTGAVSMISDVQTITHTGATSLTMSSSAANAYVKIEGGSSAYVQVESVKITDNQIGSVGDPDLITLVNDKMSLAGALDLTVDAATITHTGTTSLAISSTNGVVTIAGGSGATDYVDVESVRFTNDYIGINGDTDIIRLTSTGSQATVAIVADVDVTGKMDVSLDFAVNTDKFKVDATSGAVTMSSDAQTITHTGATSLTMSSSAANAYVMIEGGSSAYVQVESVKITDNQIGSVGDPSLITLVNEKMSLAGALDLTNEDATITHTGSTGTPTLTISSTNGPVSVVSTAEYVDVESVRFTGDQIGLSGDTAIMQLTTTGSVGDVAIDGTVTMIDDVTSLTHTGATSLAISSTNGHITIAGGANDYVDVESVRFTGDQIGLSGDTAIMQLTTSGSVGDVAIDGTVTMIDDVTSLTHTGATSLAISSTNGHITIAGGSNDYVDVESVRFTANTIGTSGDTDIITLTDGSLAVAGSLRSTGDFSVATTAFAVAALTGDTAVGGNLAVTGTSTLTGAASLSSTLDVNGATSLGSTLSVTGASTLTGAATLLSSLNVSGATALSNTLSVALDATMKSDIIMSDTSATLKHSASSGGLTITSENGYVDVEEVRFTNKKIGINSDADLISLELGGVTIAGTLDITGDLKVADTMFVVDASSGNTLVAGTLGVSSATTLSDSLDVIGVTTLSNTLTVANATTLQSTLDVAGYIKVNANKFTVDVSGNTYVDGTLRVKGVSTLQDDLVLSEDDAKITHTASTGGLTISSTNAHVDVESVRFTGEQIGTTDDPGLISLADTAVTVTGTLTVSDNVKLTEDNAVIEHTSTASGASLTIKSNTGYVDVESVRFTGDQIGLSGDTAIMQLTTSGSVGNVAIDGTVTMIDDVTSLTHTGATSLAISSTNGHITIAGGANDYVDVESVRFTDDYIGINGDTDIIRLTSTGSQATVAIVADVDVTGKMDVSLDFAVNTDKFKVDATSGAVTMSSDAQTITHTGATSLTMSSSAANAYVKIEGGSSAYVQVESVKITDNQIGSVGDPSLITLVNEKMSLAGALDLTNEDATITHTGSTGTPTLTISSTNGPVSVVSTAEYVDVESVRFTGDQIGLSGDTAIMQLTTSGSVGNVAIDGTVTMIDDVTSLTHTGATSLAIESTNGHMSQIAGGSSAYVQVETVKITDNQIGSVGDPDLITLVNEKMSLAGALDLTVDAATITHTGTTSLAISSTNGVVTIAGGSGATDYVDVESVRFTNDYIGINGDTDIIRLTSAGAGQATVAIVADVDVTGKMDVSLDFAVNTDKFKVDATSGAVTMSSDAQTITHTGATSLTMSSSAANAYVMIEGGSSAYVQVETVKITDNQIGSVGDPSLITLVNEKMSLAGALDLTNEDATITHTGSTGTPTLTISSTNGPVSVVSTAEYVDVESVRFTGDQIGLSGDTAIMQLTTSGSVGNVAIDGTVTMIDDVTSLTHTGATSLTMSSSAANAFVKIEGGSSAYVQVETVKITDNQIGSVGDPDLITLVNDKMSLAGALDLTVDAATITHTGTTSLAISSTNGVVTIAGGSGATDYVDVESVRFTNDYIGISTDTDIIRLTSAGAGQATVAIVADVDVTGKMDVSLDFAVNTDKFKVDATSGAVTMSSDAQTITHTGATSLTMSSSAANAYVKIEGGSSAYVQVESVKITDNQIGSVGDPSLITLVNEKMSLAGALDLTNEDATITHTGSTGTPTLTISSTNGPVSVVSTAEYVDVESVRFTGDQIGLSGDTAIMQLTTSGSVGNVAIDGTVTMIDDVTSLTHTGATSLAIESTNGHITIAGGSSAYVQVETVKITDNQIGSVGDPDLITLVNEKMSLAGALDLTVDAATITHTGTTSLAISSTNGVVTIAGGSGATDYVDVESVRFTNDYIGINGDTDIIRLTSAGAGQATVAIVADVDVTGKMDVSLDFAVNTDKFKVDATSGAVTMSSDAQTITHTGATSLTMSSSAANAYVMIEGGSSAYVQVETVKITDNQIGSVGDPSLITLVNEKMSLAGALDLTNEDATITHTGSTGTPTLTISSTNGPVSVVSTAEYVDVESVRFTGDQIGLSGDTAIMQLTTSGSVGNVAIDGTVTMIDDVTSLMHTGATSLSIESTNGHITIAGGANDYVDVELVRFTDASIGTTGDADLVTLADDKVTIKGSLDTDGYIKVATTKFVVDASGNTYADGTFGVKGVSTLQDDLELSEDSAAITHTGTTSLAISSTNGHITIAGGSSVTDYVDVESVRFTGDKIGLSGDTAIMQLTTSGSVGNVAIDGTVTMIDDVTSLTHTGATSLAIESTNGHITIAGGSLTTDYVDVESVRFTDDFIGTTGDADLVRLEANKVTVKGTLTTTDDILMSEATASLTHDAGTSGVGLAITSTNGYVDVESVRFTDNQIGLHGTDGLVTLSSSGVDIAGSLDTDGYFKVADTKFTIDVSGNTYADGTLGVKGLASLQNNLELSKTDAAIEHTGTGATTGLTISSDNGYVDVESVRFTGDATIGTTDDPGLISLADTDGDGDRHADSV